MAFNHYARIKRLLADQPAGWYIKRIDEPTSTRTFAGELRHYDHYYRLYDAHGQPIKYGKFQQIDRLAQALDIPSEALSIVE